MAPPFPPLWTVFQFSLGWSPLDNALNCAYVSIIPKPGKDASDVSHYHPISLINNDLKIMMKILAVRLSSLIVNYIHKDQVGFIPGIQGPDQIRRAIDLISLLHYRWDKGPPQDGFLLSIDLQKAVDSVSWSYLFEILERWGFGSKFLTTMHALYLKRSAQIRLMGH